MKYCAVCLAEGRPLELDPDLDVLTCQPCREEHPRQGRYTFSDRRDPVRPAKSSGGVGGQ